VGFLIDFHNMRCGSEEFEINFTLRSPFIIFASLRRRSIAGYVTDEQREKQLKDNFI
jgi:hypothetical protein